MSEEEDAAIAVLLAIADIDNAPLINPVQAQRLNKAKRQQQISSKLQQQFPILF